MFFFRGIFKFFLRFFNKCWFFLILLEYFLVLNLFLLFFLLFGNFIVVLDK